MLINQLFRKAVIFTTLFAMPLASYAQISIGISINIAPPVLPIYVQPPCPEPNYIWTPGYWSWDPGSGDYFWVPGTWVLAPQPGYLWTPGYWGWGDGGVYLFHTGYWGAHVGFYGGVNYGFGYGGIGFGGGEWRNGAFAYNTAVSNVNTTVIHTTYINNTVINNTTINNTTRTSFNGGPSGVAAKPTAQEQAYASQPHVQPTAAQVQHQTVAKQDRSNFAAVNHGVPAHAAVPRPVTNVAELKRVAVPAKAAGGTQPVNRPAPASRPQANKVAAAAPKPQPKPATHAQPAPESRPAPARNPAPAARPPAPKPPAPRPAPAARPAPPPHPKEPPQKEHP